MLQESHRIQRITLKYHAILLKKIDLKQNPPILNMLFVYWGTSAWFYPALGSTKQGNQTNGDFSLLTLAP